MTRSRWIAVAVLSATFLAGAMLGAATTRLLASEREEPRSEREADGRRDARGPQPSVFDRLNLTAEQRAAVDSIMEKRGRDMAAFWKEHNPEVRGIVDSARVEIDRVLTPEQREKYEEFRERRRREHSNPDGRSGPPPNWGPGPGGPDGPRPESDDSARRPISYHEPQYL